VSALRLSKHGGAGVFVVPLVACCLGTFTVDAVQDLVGVLVQMKGYLRWFQPVMKVRILATRSERALVRSGGRI